MNTATVVKVVDYFNGWSSRPMTWPEAEKLLVECPSRRGIEPASAEWRWDGRYSEWAWFDAGWRIS